jgi:hypothetical protein
VTTVRKIILLVQRIKQNPKELPKMAKKYGMLTLGARGVIPSRYIESLLRVHGHLPSTYPPGKLKIYSRGNYQFVQWVSAG